MPGAAARCCSGAPTGETAVPDLFVIYRRVRSHVTLQSPQLMTFYDLLDDEEEEDDDEDAADDDDHDDDDGDDDGSDTDDEIGGGHGMSLDASDVRPPRCAPRCPALACTSLQRY